MTARPRQSRWRLLTLSAAAGLGLALVGPVAAPALADPAIPAPPLDPSAMVAQVGLS